MTDGDSVDSGTAKVKVLKRDGRGRVRSTAAQRQKVLDEFNRSGLSGPAFARVAGIPYQTLATWRKKRKQGSLAVRSAVAKAQGAGGGGTSVRLVEAVIGRPPAGSFTAAGLCVSLPGGASLAIKEASQVTLAAQLLKALDLASPC